MMNCCSHGPQDENLDTKWKNQNYVRAGGPKPQRECQWRHVCLRDTPRYERQWRHPCLRGTSQCAHPQPHPLSVVHNFLGSVVVSSSSHTCTLAQDVRAIHIIPHGHPRVCDLFALILPFYFLLYFPSLFLFLNYMKSVVNLHNSANESMDASDDHLLSTGYEPKAPWLLRDHSRAPRAAPELAGAPLQQSLYCGPRLRWRHTRRHALSSTSSESLSLFTRRLVCQSVVSLSSSSTSDRTGRPVLNRSGQPGEHRSSEAQIRTLLDDQQEQILAECQARICQHEFQAARAEEVQQRDQRLLQGLLLQQKLEFSWSSSKKSHRNGRTKEVSELCIRHYGKTKLHRGSEHYIETFWPSTGNCKMK